MNQQNNTSNNDADFASIEEIIAAIGRGELVVMVDDEDREPPNGVHDFSRLA